MGAIVAIQFSIFCMCVVWMVIRYFVVRDSDYYTFWQDMFWDEGPNTPFGIIIGLISFWLMLVLAKMNYGWISKLFGE